MSTTTRPMKPRPVGRHVRQQLQDVELDLGAADRELEPLAAGDLHAARAQTFISKAALKIARILGLGTDHDDNGTGNGEHQ